jgi:pimeloyl-ACP methyl ester carboxylesterase
MFKQRIVFVHGAGPFGAAAWPRQHGMALNYDALFLRRHGFDPVAEPVESSFDEDTDIVLRSLADDGRGASGGHVVAHAQGAIAAMMAAVERPDLVYSLTLVEPACLSLTAELPATAAHRALMQPLFDVRHQLGDEDFQREYVRRMFAVDLQEPASQEEKRSARRLRLQAPAWEAPLHIVPGVPTMVLTGGWERL